MLAQLVAVGSSGGGTKIGIEAPGVLVSSPGWFSVNSCDFCHLMVISDHVIKKGEPWTEITVTVSDPTRTWTELHCSCALGQLGLSMPPPLM